MTNAQTSWRQECVTEKVSTQYGSHYVHIEHDSGRITGVSISSPGKFSSSALSDMLGALSAAATDIITDITDAA